MPPKQQGQRQQQPQRQQAGSGGGGGGSGGRAAPAPAPSGPAARGGMNYFAALSGTDADALKEEIAGQQEERRQAAAAASSRSNGGAANGQQRGGSNRDGGTGESGMKQPLVWIDLEMTGLDVESDSIMQIAVICTDGNLETVVEGPELAVHQPEEVLAGMNEWCVEQHGKSGLTKACRESPTSLAEAEQAVLEFVQHHVPEPSIAQIAGNSVHVDLAFLRKHMPRLVDHLSYRIVDVSTVGELCRRWFPREHSRAPKKRNTHTAMSDIRESIKQLQYYRKNIFIKWSGPNLPVWRHMQPKY